MRTPTKQLLVAIALLNFTCTMGRTADVEGTSRTDGLSENGFKSAVPETKVTLVLGGGALKSLGSIGVLRVLERNRVHVDCIYGTSAGAVIGAFYASGMPVAEIEKLFVRGVWQRAAEHHIYIKAAVLPVTKIVPLGPNNKWPGILGGAHYQRFLESKLPHTFTDLKIPFRAVATDLCTGSAVVLKDGDLPLAVRASSSCSPALKPVELSDKLLADGGLRANLPVQCARLAGEGDFVISVSSDGPLTVRNKRYFNSLQRLNRRVFDLMSFQGDLGAMDKSNILIVPDIDDTPIMTKNSRKVKAAIAAGERAAESALPRIVEAVGMTSSTPL